MKSSKVIFWSVLIIFVTLVGVAVYFSTSSEYQEVRDTKVDEDSESGSFLNNLFQKNDFMEEESIAVGDELSVFVENLQSGGPPPDGIPPVDEPEYSSVEDAGDFLTDQDRIFVVDINGEVKLYPQQVLVWHEIVNDTFGDEELSVTYCPLTGTAIGYKNQFESVDSDFGTSGKLLNSNLVMYDRQTDSLWPQIYGVGITGEHRGIEAELFPVVWTTWEKARAHYPEAQVLSKNTGFIRSYGFDPYGSYLEDDTYYDSGEPFFPLLNEDDRLDAKEVVLGVKINGEQTAILKSKIENEKVVRTTVGSVPVVAIWDEDLETARAYIDSGVSELNEDALEWAPSFDAMWFSWVAYYPETGLEI
jgi:hypothetical protein